MIEGQILTRKRGRRSSLRNPAQVKPRLKLGDREFWVVFLLAVAVNLAMCYTVVYTLNIFVTDAMSRTLHAWQVFFSAYPKLTNIGFIWAPLPTLLQLPLVLIPPLRADGLSGNILTAIMGALTAVTINQTLRLWPIERLYRYAIMAAFVLNPMILFYSSNGLSEMTFVFFTILSIHLLILWQRSEHYMYLGLLGMSVAMAFLARYDTVVHAMLLIGVIWIVSLKMPESSFAKSQALIVFFGVPVIFATGLWVMFNWMFMGDALHFVRGEYSNAAQIDYQMVLLSNIETLRHNPIGITKYIGTETGQLFPPFLLGIGLLTFDFLVTKNRLAISLAMLALSFPVFQGMNMFEGQSAAFLRYFILAIPYGILLVGFQISRIRPKWAILKHAVRVIAVLVLAGSGILSGWKMNQATEWGQWNDIFLNALIHQYRVDAWSEEREIARYLDERIDRRGVLVDDFQGYRVIFYTGKPWLFVATGDDDFKETLENPVGKASYILASPTKLEGVLNKINKQYPALYDHGTEWATLEKEWQELGWRLYRVAEPAPPPSPQPS